MRALLGVVQDRVAEAEREMEAIDMKLGSMVSIVDEISRVCMCVWFWWSRLSWPAFSHQPLSAYESTACPCLAV